MRFLQWARTSRRLGAGTDEREEAFEFRGEGPGDWRRRSRLPVLLVVGLALAVGSGLLLSSGQRASNSVLLSAASEEDTGVSPQRAAERLQTKFRDDVRGCMEQRGFQYLAPPPPSHGPSSNAGYGLAMAATKGSEGRGGPVDQESRDYYHSLSPERQQAYVEALAGKGAGTPEIPSTQSGAEAAARSDGCAQRALKSRHEIEARALPALDKIGRELDQSPDHAAAQKRWARCMSDSGRPFERPEAARAYVKEKVSAFQTEVGQTLAGKTAEEAAALRPQLEQKLAIIAGEEQQIADLDNGCAERTGLKELEGRLAGRSLTELRSADPEAYALLTGEN